MKKNLIKTILLVVIAALLGSLLAGCGGGSNGGNAGAAADTTVTTSSQSKAEFIKLANAICDRDRSHIMSELSLYMNEHGKEAKNEAEALAQAIQATFIPKAETQIQEIRALGAPRGDEQQIESFLSAMEEGVNSANRSHPRSQGSFTEYFKRSAELAKGYGIDRCIY